MAKLTKKIIEARISRAIVGFQIPIMSLSKLSARLEHAIKAEMSDEYLRDIVATFPDVVEV